MDGRGRGVRSDLARLRGARLVVGAEIERGARFAEVLVKQMTGGDKIVASYLYKNEFEFRPTFKVWLGANALPEILGTDHAIWRRVRRVPFPVKIERPDKTLPQKLRNELPGILNWAVAGCLAWQRDGLGVPEAVKAATQEYRYSQDSVRLFLQEECRLDDEARVNPSALRDAYEVFCKRRGLHAVDTRAFIVSLEGHGLRRHKSGSSRSWRGITVGGGT
jgi:putative DNA primase/helicase